MASTEHRSGMSAVGMSAVGNFCREINREIDAAPASLHSVARGSSKLLGLRGGRVRIAI